MRVELTGLIVIVSFVFAGYGYPASRIKRKTIFIPPSFGSSSCAKGYFLDDSGDCLKVIELDQQNYRVFLITEKLRSIEYEDDYDEENDREESYIAIQGPPLNAGKAHMENSGIEKRNTEPTENNTQEMSTIVLPLSSIKLLNARETSRNNEITSAINKFNVSTKKNNSRTNADVSNLKIPLCMLKPAIKRIRQKLIKYHKPLLKPRISNLNLTNQKTNAINKTRMKLTLKIAPQDLNANDSFNVSALFNNNCTNNVLQVITEASIPLMATPEEHLTAAEENLTVLNEENLLTTTTSTSINFPTKTKILKRKETEAGSQFSAPIAFIFN